MSADTSPEKSRKTWVKPAIVRADVKDVTRNGPNSGADHAASTMS